ncbi:MAG: ankyrin repeat domain-containing protein [Amoebophilaceae bacterium]|nr:ankyrin repeat domain-containing protein [Amoebophilaceae bacterium]
MAISIAFAIFTLSYKVPKRIRQCKIDILTYIDKNKNWRADSFDLLRDAIADNNLEMFKYLVKQGANINAKDSKNGFTVFHAAIIEKNTAIIRYLME